MDMVLKRIGAIIGVLGLLLGLLAMGDGNMLLVPAGVAMVISGVLFVGFGEVIRLLTDIRAALVPPKAAADDAGSI